MSLLDRLRVRGISWRAILEAMRPERRRIVTVVFLSLGAAVMDGVFIGSLYGLVSDTFPARVAALLSQWAVVPSSWPGLLTAYPLPIMGGLCVIALALRLLTTLGTRYEAVNIQVSVGCRYSTRLVGAYMDAHPSVWQRWKVEEIAHAVYADSFACGQMIFTLLSCGAALLSGAALFIGGAYLSWQLILIAAVLGAIVMLINQARYRYAAAIGEEKIQAQSGFLGYVFDVLNGYKRVKVEGAEDEVREDLDEHVEGAQAWRIRKMRNSALAFALSEGVLYLSVIVIVLAAMGLELAGPAVLLAFMVLAVRTQSYLREAQMQWMDFQEYVPSLAKVEGILEEASASAYEPDRFRAYEPGHDEGFSLTCREVHYAYPGGEPVLTGLSMDVGRGERVLVQGPSGCGKSTLVNLMCGFLQPTRGEVRIDDVPLSWREFYRLRPHLSYAAADNYLFRESIRKNVELGTRASVQELEDALEKAGLTELVSNLPEGVDSFIGENGSRLSLGQRQRVVLARIFLKRPRLVFLDEATSNLDLDLERRILGDLIDHLPTHTTVIMVAHRAPESFPFTHHYVLRDGRLRAADPELSVARPFSDGY